MKETNLSIIPEQPGVYMFLDSKNTIIYTGKAINLRKRLASYFNSSFKSVKTLKMVSNAVDINFILTNNETEALLLESNIIKTEKPKYNILLKDSKGYPYLMVTDDKYPRIMFTRDISNRNALYFGPFISASVLRGILRDILWMFPLRSCTEKKFSKGKRCLYYQIKLCKAPCENLINENDYGSIVNEIKHFFKGDIKSLRNILHDKMLYFSSKLMFEEAAKIRDRINSLDKLFQNQGVTLDIHIESLDYFIAKVTESTIAVAKIFIRNSKVIGVKTDFIDNPVEFSITQYILQFYNHMRQFPKEIGYHTEENFDENVLLDALTSLSSYKMKLRKRIPNSILKIGIENIASEEKVMLQKMDNIYKAINKLSDIVSIEFSEIRSIECIDISHISGNFTVGASICWEKDIGFNKKRYRRYKLKGIENDDFQSIYQLMDRKAKHIINNDDLLSDIYLIDGGVGQLNAAVKAFNENNINSTIIAISKGRNQKDITKIDSNSPESLHLYKRKNSIQFKKNDPALLLLQRIRDEVHRFVIEYSRKLALKSLKYSPLRDIKGIGENRIKTLLIEFPDIYTNITITPDEIKKRCSFPMEICNDIIKYVENIRLNGSGDKNDKE